MQSISRFSHLRRVQWQRPAGNVMRGIVRSPPSRRASLLIMHTSSPSLRHSACCSWKKAITAEANRMYSVTAGSNVRDRWNHRNDSICASNRFVVNPVIFNTPHRTLGTSCVRSKELSSKVEQTVNALKEEHKETTECQKQGNGVVGKESEATSSVKTQVAKRPLSKRVWDELVHYYHGFRLLFIDIRIASRLVRNVLNGEELTRREYRQLSRTTADIFRLVPFSIFIIVPFMEFLLPVFLKFFPGMLPSTFMSAKDKESKVKQQLKVKLDMTKFLQTTLDEMALTSTGTEHHSESAKEFAEFFNEIRKSGKMVPTDDILRFSKLFEDEITLDSLSRPQLIALCRLLELKPIGPNNVLRFQLRMQLRSLKSDDRMIQKEGIDTLTVPELQQACRARGMRALGVAEDRLRTQLSQWLELSLNEKIPPSLLLLSRILYLPENIPAADQLKATIQALPAEVGTEAKYKIGETEGKIDNRTRLELIRQEEAAIRQEREEAAREKADAAAAQAAAAVASDQCETLVDTASAVTDRAVSMESSTAPAEPVTEDKISPEDLDKLEQALDQLSSDSKSMAVEKEELEDIKEEMADYKEDIEEFNEIAKLTGKKQLVESAAAKSLRKRVDRMINKMDNVMEELESKKEKIEEKLQILKTDDDAEEEKENLVNVTELLSSIRKIQSMEDDTKLKTIIDVLDSMDTDHDGKIDVDHVVNVIELLGRENVDISSDQMKDIIKLLIREDQEKEKEKSEKISELAAESRESSPPHPSSETPASKSAT